MIVAKIRRALFYFYFLYLLNMEDQDFQPTKIKYSSLG